MSGFNFGGSGASSGGGLFGGGGSSFGGTPATTTTGSTGFSFGATKPTTTTAPSTGFSFGGATSAPNSEASTAPASGGFSFGGTKTPGSGGLFGASSAAPTANTGLSSASSTTPATGGFSFGASSKPAVPAPTTSESTGFSLRTAASGTTTGFSLGTAGSKPTSGFSIGAPAATTTSASSAGFSFAGTGTPAVKPTETVPATTIAPVPTASSGFSLSTPASGGFSLTSQPKASEAPSSTFSFGGASAASTAAPSIAAPVTINPSTTSNQSSTTTSFGAKSDPVSTASGLFAAKPAAVTTTTKPAASGISFGATPATKTAGLFGTTTTTTTISGETTSKEADLTWQDLENKINKWNTDIEQQVSVFIKQATQVNAWSSLLLSNGEKISDLCNQLESVKVEQDELDQELDRVNAQQVELEAILKPLEDAASKNRSSSQQHVDNERERTYNLAGSVDAQIKLLAQDLREVIERINSQQGNGGNNQLESITSILSSHTDALQWVEEQSSTLQRRLDQVTKAVDTRASMEQRNF